MDVDLERRLVAHDQDRIPELLQHRCERAAIEARPGDDEVGAVAEPAVLVVRAGVGRRGVVRHLQRGVDVAAQPGDHAGEDHHQTVRPRVHHAGLAQDLELLRRTGHRRLSVPHGVLEELGEQRILLGRASVGREADLLHVGEATRDRGRHFAEHRQHRPLGRLAHRFVGSLRRSREGGRDQHRVDQLAGAAGELLGGPTNDLAEDHSRVAPGAHQRGARQSIDQLGAADLVDHLAVEPVELLADGPQGRAPCCPRCRRQRPGTR